jgi:hypothetical protein
MSLGGPARPALRCLPHPPLPPPPLLLLLPLAPLLLPQSLPLLPAKRGWLKFPNFFARVLNEKIRRRLAPGRGEVANLDKGYPRE